jgi:hypothetical protein
MKNVIKFWNKNYNAAGSWYQRHRKSVYQVEMETDRICMESDPDIIFYHI